MSRFMDRMEEAWAIVEALAEISPFYDHNGCVYCGHQVHCTGIDPHDDECLYERARRLVEQKKVLP